MVTIRDNLHDLLREKGIELTDKQWEQLEIYYRELIEWNEKINLTAITDKKGVSVKHFYDSISLSFFLPFGQIWTMADIGSGAGFPALPLKIVFPHLKVTVMDSLKKRVQFLEHLTAKLDLDNVQCCHGRAEDFGRDTNHRDTYDLVTARAVARLNVLGEICLPFVREGGTFAAMKGSQVQDEVEEADACIRALASELKAVHSLELPLEKAGRHIVVISKKGKTPGKFPRRAGIPFKKPL